jgi:acetyl-CoA synthetase
MRDPDEFWERQGQIRVGWYRPFDRLKEWQPPYARWFSGGTLNACDSCVDRHVRAGDGGKVAIHWDGGDDRRDITYAGLLREVVRFAGTLRRLGVGRGTPVGIRLGVVPERVIAQLACARLGAPFALLPDPAAIRDFNAAVVITRTLSFVRRTPTPQSTVDGREVPYARAGAGVSDDPESCPCAVMGAEDRLFVGYPGGIVHTTAGYLVGVATTHQYAFDTRPGAVYWATTARSTVDDVFAPLCNGATLVLTADGAARWPTILDRYGVTAWRADPATIRTLRRSPPTEPAALRRLAGAHRPLTPTEWNRFHTTAGHGRVPLVDVWQRADTGMVMLAALPGGGPVKPGSVGQPLPGVDAAVLDEQGLEVAPGVPGNLVVRSPWPAMLRGIHRDPDRYLRTYWSRYPNLFSAGVPARVDEDGDFWLAGNLI